MTQEQLNIIADADLNRPHLSDFENGFIEGLRRRPVNADLSEKQDRILGQIGKKLERANTV
jgi:hypothetical protein